MADGINRKLVIDAAPSNAGRVIDFVADTVGQAGCPTKVRTQLSICVDEVFANISRYAYDEQTGQVEVSVAVSQGQQRVIVEFRDKGVAFDPLERDDPDVTLSAEDRAIGGLGIFMVKEIADEVTYHRDGDFNVLAIAKDF